MNEQALLVTERIVDFVNKNRERAKVPIIDFNYSCK